MLLLSVLLLTKGCATGDEFLLVQVATGVRHLVAAPLISPSNATPTRQAPTRQAPSADDRFLFVDVAYDLSLVEKLGPDQFPLGNQAITNRASLASFLELLGRHTDTYQYILCDIRFEDPSPNDATLARSIERLPRLIVPFHLDANDTRKDPLFDVHAGWADYTPNWGDFLKFKLRHPNGHPSVPLLMFKALYPDRTAEGPLYLNSFIPDPRLRPHHLGTTPLNELLTTSRFYNREEDFAETYFRDRIIVIGDFSGDVHPTVLGPMPGPLLLVNTFLGLEAGDNRMSFGWLLLMWLGFGIVSYDGFSRVLYHETARSSRRRPWMHHLHVLPSPVRRLILVVFLWPRLSSTSLFSRGLMHAQRRFSDGRILVELIALTFLSYGLFGVHVHVLILAVYVWILRGLLRLWLSTLPTSSNAPALHPS